MSRFSRRPHLLPHVMNPLRCLALTILCLPTDAQSPAPAFLPESVLSECSVDGIPQLVAHWPASAFARLLAEPEVMACWHLGAGRLHARLEHQRLVLGAARDERVELEPWAVARLPGTAIWQTLAGLQFTDVERLACSITGRAKGDELLTIWSLICAPRDDGRLAAVFEVALRGLSTRPGWRECDGIKIDGLPARAFVSLPTDRQLMAFAPQDPARCWLLHMPNAFYFGEGTPDQCGRLGTTSEAQATGITFTCDLARQSELFSSRVGLANGIAAFGVQPKGIRWRMRVHGEQFHEEVSVDFDDAPRGALGSLLHLRAAAPPQALPAGSLLQLRLALDPGHLLMAIEKLAGIAVPLSASAKDELASALTGGMSLGIGAPRRGTWVPRLYASFGIADAERLQSLLEGSGPVVRRAVVHDGVHCTVCTVPGLPATVHPTFAVSQGVLHVTESLASMQALISAQRSGATAMEIADAPRPTVDGEPVPEFELRCDSAALYTAWYESWLPWFERNRPTTWPEPLLARDEMPRPAVVAPFLGSSRGVLRRTEHGITFHVLGPMGGPIMTSFVLAYGPTLSGWFPDDELTSHVAEQLTRARLRQVWLALDGWRETHGAWPARLDELVAAGKLGQEVLILPGDSQAETLTLLDGAPVRSSFRYLPTPTKVTGWENHGDIVLIAIAPNRQGRLMLADDGSVIRLGEPSAQRVVDGILAATKR